MNERELLGLELILAGVTPNEWLDDYLTKNRGKDAMLEEAERIVELLDVRVIEAVFGKQLAGRVNPSVRDGLMQYLEELPRGREIRSNLRAVLKTIEPGLIEEEYEAEMESEQRREGVAARRKVEQESLRPRRAEGGS